MTRNAWVIGRLLCALLCLPLSGCSEPTVGQQFRDIMADIEAECRKKGRVAYPRAKHSTDGSCDILKIKPADPLATAEGRFAYSIKLPPPYDKPKVEYKKGMSAETYFKELCEKEEGDFVFRTVEGVEGIKIMRPIPKDTGVPLWNEAGGPPPGLFVDAQNGIYDHVDAVELVQEMQKNTQLFRYAIDPNQSTQIRPWGLSRIPIANSEARYGYTFRNSPLENREFGVVGKELIILDTETNEVLALRRRFSRLNFIDKNAVQSMSSTPCRLIPTENSDNRFIAKTLKPAMKIDGDKR